MANSALIEDLRKQFAENPRRVFARLANEYRKSGDLNVAIEICRAHVPLQPTYISGYIVLGQALFERGQPEEARSTFETALTLDPENLIALRQLGDIARASGDLDAARGWYHKLLEVDPQNEEIAAQLAELDAPAHTTASATPVESSPVSWSDIHPDSPAVTPPAPPAPAAASQPARPRFTIGVIPENLATDPPATTPPTSAPVMPPAAAPQASAPPESTAKEVAASAAPVEAAASEAAILPESFGGFDRHAPTPPVGSPAIPAPNSAGEIELDPSAMTSDAAEASVPELMDISDLAPSAPAAPESAHADLPAIATTAEFSVPAMPTAPAAPQTPAAPPVTAAELATLFAGPELETARPAAAASSAKSSEEDESSRATFEEEPYDPTIGRMLELSSRTSSDALLPDLMMTESGAELLREQGHIDQAIYVYRHLAAKNPHDTSYAGRIAALESGAHSSIPLIASISQDVISAAKNRPYSTKNVRSFFTSFATRKAPGSESDAGESQQSESHESESHESESHESDSVAQGTAATMPEAVTVEATAAETPVAEAAVAETPAAGTPAAVHEPSPPETVSDDDRSALETLFSGKPKVAANDERAAAALASAFSEDFTPDANAPAGQPTRAASDALSLDAVFQTTRPRAEGEHRASQPTVSFDEFFSNRENGNGAVETKSDAAVETASHSEDSQSDLELFHEWLDGLKK